MLFTSITEAYTYHYNKQKDKYTFVGLTDEENEVISQYATDASELRWGKPGFEGTSKEKLRDAFFLGGSGETVVAKLLGNKQGDLEFSVGGDAKDYAHADLECLGYCGIGVKVSRYGLPPMIVQKELWTEGRCGDELICTVFDKDIERDFNGNIKRVKGVWINGIATEDILKKYQSRDLIKCKDNPKYADRAGWYGFHKLKTLSNKNEIDAFKAEYKLIS
jgi:hypothetical protein